jgi:hypothetical protein
MLASCLVRGASMTTAMVEHDPREDLTALSSPAAVIINGIRVR